MSFQRAEGFRLFHRIVDTLLMRTVRRSTVSIGLSLVLNYTTKISRMRPRRRDASLIELSLTRKR